MPRTSRYRATLTPEQFDALAQSHPNMQASSRQAAFDVLVGGSSLLESATKHGVSKQRVGELVGILCPTPPPPGWISRTVTLPPELMKQVLLMEEQALKDHRG